MNAIRNVGEKRARVQDAERDWLEARSRRDNDKEIELGLYEKYLRATNAFDASAERALEKIRVIYRIDPPQLGGKVHAPGVLSGSLDWTKDTEIHWKPRVAVDGPEYRRYQGPNGEIHYAGSDALDAAATTDVLDGSVEISYEEISLAIAEKNPGLIASTLYHESIHFQELMSKGCNSREESELSAYNKEIKASPVFDLPQSRLEEISKARDGFQRDFDAGVRTPFGTVQGEEDQMEAGFDAQQLNRRELASYYDDLKAVVQQIRKDRLEREQEEDRQRRAAEYDRARAIRDANLRGNLRDIALRICADPDGVDQAELNSLPAPSDIYALMRRPEGLDSTCSNRVYSYLSLHLSPAESPDIAAVRQVIADSVPARLVPAPQPAGPPERGPAPLLEERALGRLATMACASPQNLSQSDVSEIARLITEVREPDKIAATLSGCPREVFRRLVQMVRSGEIQSNRALELIRRAATPPPPPPPINPPPIHHEEKDPPVDPCRRAYGDYCNG